MTIYGYARVSTTGQDLEAQLQMLEHEGATVIYREKFTGTSTDRPELNKLLEQLQEGDKLIVTKLDRLARNTKEGIEIIENLFDRDVKVQVAITRNLPIVLQIASYIFSSFSTLTTPGLKAVKAQVNEDKTPIGCAFLGKPSMIFFISSFTNVCLRISVSNFSI